MYGYRAATYRQRQNHEGLAVSADVKMGLPQLGWNKIDETFLLTTI